MVKPNFSVVVIAKNEEKTLPRLLKSLEEFRERGGEFFLLDTGSTDNTRAIAVEWGAKVASAGDAFKRLIGSQAYFINKNFIVQDEKPIVKDDDSYFDFAAARNEAARYASNDFIAMPDCDEVFTTFKIDNIQAAIMEIDCNQLAYNFVFSHKEDGSRELEFEHSKFYHRKYLEWKGIVHEILAERETSLCKRIRLPESTILLEHFQNKETNRAQYMIGLAADLSYYSDNDRNTHYLAREFMYTGRYKSAIKLFEKHTQMIGWIPEQARSMLFIGDCFQYLGMVDKAKLAWSKAFDMYTSREPLLRLADWYFKSKEYAKCIAYGEAALSVNPDKDKPYFVERKFYEAYPHHLLYAAYEWIGEKEKAKHHWMQCLSFEPLNNGFLEDRKFFFKQ